MIRITYAHARSFTQQRELLLKLFNTQMPTKTAKRLKRIMERVGLAARYVDEQQYGLQVQAAKEFGVLDEKGEPKVDEKGELVFENDELRGQANKLVMLGMGPILKRELVLVLDPLDLDETKLELTLSEVDMLGPILMGDDETDATQESVSDVSASS